MSGLFAFRRRAVQLDWLRPTGFKVLLEVLVRQPSLRVAEVSYTFAPRTAGRSKATVREGVNFLRHLGGLRRDVLTHQLRQRPVAPRDRMLQLLRVLAVGLVGLSGVAVNTVALWGAYHVAGWPAVVGAMLATQCSTLWNFVLTDLLVYPGTKRGTRRGRATRFFVMNNLLLLARLPLFVLLVHFGVAVLVANAALLVLLFLLRFAISDRVIYDSAGLSSEGPSRDPVRVLVDSTEPNRAPGRKRSQYLKHRYYIAGVVTIGSQIPLPELEFFRAQWVADGEVDIAIRIGDVGLRRPRSRALMTQFVEHGCDEPVTLRYEEHLGRLGANFRVELGEPIIVTVGPLLARSPHVVYTNVIEALLRFAMVSRGKALLHSACIVLDGRGVMLSALTDTGKTATVLRLLRERGGMFLSDDMTMVDAGGKAICFPKPLTISSHTLRAVQADDLTPKEWRRLQLQSRLHSKGGRSIALTLAKFNLPIMGINAITQILVPPPKYAVDRLVPCRVASMTQVENLFIIERGAPKLADLDPMSSLERMLANTDDAYGFPPFKYFTPAISIGGLGYRELRERERDILRGFLTSVRTRTLASDTFGWADEISRLLRQENGGPADIPTTSGLSTRRSSGHVADFPRWGGVAPEAAVS